MFKEVKEVQAFCEKHHIRMIDFKMMDLDGRWRHLSIPSQRFNEDIMQTGIGFDGSNYGYAPVENSDMVFIPVLESAAVDPFSEVPALTMIGDVKVIGKDENRHFDQYPRSVSLAAEAFLRESGVADEMIIGPEYEFHLFDHVSCEVRPGKVSYHVNADQSAEWNNSIEDEMNLGYRLKSKAGYHACKPQDSTNDIRNRMCLMMEELGVKVKYQHHEVGGSGQCEIEVELGGLTEMADKTMLTKYVIKNQAIEEGLTATFMPKPIHNEAGNGMHVHMLLLKNGQPVFYDENGYSGLSQTAMYFIGGILKHAASLCGFTNPSTNSYKRLVPGFEAPATVGFATANRSAVIRVPAYAKSPKSKRFELRNPDATCNPYYAYAAILMAGLDGIEQQIDPCKNGWGPFDYNLYDLSEKAKKKIQHLPVSLEEALLALEKDHEYLTKGGVFPKRLIEIWISKKRKEAERISKIPHPAEIEDYFDL